MPNLPSFVHVREEGPREAFQFEKSAIPTAKKIELIDALSETGLVEIQAVSFVSPSRVPGMADAEEVVKRIQRKPRVRYSALWLNDRGFLRAVAAKDLYLTGRIALTASTAFLLKNQHCSMEEDLNAQREMIRLYALHNVPTEQINILAAFGCNFEGDIAPQKVVGLVEQLILLAGENKLQIKSVKLADTMAWATPLSIKRLVGAVRDRFPTLHIALHLHDTRGLGVANAYAGLECGVDSFDTAIGGLGGCPFAGHAGAAGNLCTEDFVFMLQEMGIKTGLDLEKLIAAAMLAERVVGHPLPGSVMKGGSLNKFREKIRA
jgi:hydroxymethylglutaryl-CoA lyase